MVLTENVILSKIISIGFEFETGNMIPMTFIYIDIDEETNTLINKPYQIMYVPCTLDNVILSKIPVESTNMLVTTTSTFDAPHIAYGQTTQLSWLEERVKSEKKIYDFMLNDAYIHPYFSNKMLKGIPQYDPTYVPKYNFFGHAEFNILFIPNIGCSINDSNVIMNSFKYVVHNLLYNTFTVKREVKSKPLNIKIKEYRATMQNGNVCCYCIPMEYDQNYTPASIKWVPQMTMNVKLIDIIDVVSYISLETNAEDDIRFCIDMSNEVFKDINDDNAYDLNSKLKALLFMLIYLLIRLGGNNGNDNNSNDISIDAEVSNAYNRYHVFHCTAGKNTLAFLFRTSIAEIMVALYKEYGEPIMTDYLTKMDASLKANITKLRAKVRRMKKQIDIDCLNAFRAFSMFIGFLKSNTYLDSDDLIDDLIEHAMKARDEEYMNREKLIKTTRPNYMTAYYESYEPKEQLYLYFVRLFSEEYERNEIGVASYFEYNETSQSILIEYRSFAQGINGLEHNKHKKMTIHKSLYEWNSALSSSSFYY